MENPFDIFEQIYEAHDNGEISDEEMVFLCESAEEKLMLVQENFFGIGGAVETRGKQLVDKMVKDICEYASKTLKAGKDVTIGPIADIIKSIGAKIVGTIGNLDVKKTVHRDNVDGKYTYDADSLTNLLIGHEEGTLKRYFVELPAKMKPFIEKSNKAESYSDKYNAIKQGASELKKDIMKLSTNIAKHYAEFFKDHHDSNGKTAGDKINDAVNKHLAAYKKNALPEKVNGKESLKNTVSNAKSGMKMVKDIISDSKKALKRSPNKTVKGVDNLDIPEEYMRKSLQIPKLQMGSGERKNLTIELPRAYSDTKNKNTTKIEKLAAKIGKRSNSHLKKARDVDHEYASPYHVGKFK